MKNNYMVIILAILIVGMVAISACTSSGSGSSGVSYTTSATPTNPAIEMVNKDMAYKSYGDVYCFGVLKSNVNKPLTATVKMSLYDKNDIKLGEGSDFVQIDPMGKSTFEAIVFGSDKYTDEFETYKCYIDHVY